MIERASTTEHTGRLQPLRRVVSPERVLTSDVAALTGAVAARYAGTRSDVLRLAVPPRHATVEKETVRAAPADRGRRRPPTCATTPAGPGCWTGLAPEGVAPRRLDGRPRRRLGRAPGRGRRRDRRLGPGRAGVRARPPRRRPAGRGAHRAAGRGPPRRAGRGLWPGQALPRLPGDQPRRRPHRHRHPSRHVRAGARPRPGRDLGRRRRPPRRAAGAVPPCPRGAAMRAQETGCAAVLAAHVAASRRSTSSGPAGPPRSSPRVTSYASASPCTSPATPTGTSNATPPHAPPGCRPRLQPAPRRRQSRTRARADAPGRLRDAARLRPMPYAGPVHRLPRTAPPAWTPATSRVRLVRHPGTRLAMCRVRGTGPARSRPRRRPHRRGAGPCPAGVPVRTSSSGDGVLARSTRARRSWSPPRGRAGRDGGYAAVVLMDTWLLLARSDLRATEEAVRRWANAAALVRPATDGGRVLCVGDASHPGLQALVRWDPSGLARREIEERQSAHLPPASRVATVTGEPPTSSRRWPRCSCPLAPRCWVRSRRVGPGGAR